MPISEGRLSVLFLVKFFSVLIVIIQRSENTKIDIAAKDAGNGFLLLQSPGWKELNYLSNIGAKEIGSRKIALEFLPKNSVDRREAVDFLSRYVVPGSNLFSDGAAIYRGIQNWWPVNHQFERHNRFQFTLTSEIEGLWGNYFTFVRRMYHHVTFSKAPSMLNEFSLRFSCPEYFVSPARYLEIALKSIRRSRAKLWITFLKKILETETIESPLVSKLKLVMPGARCL